MAASILGAASLVCIGTGVVLDVAIQNGMFDFLPEFLGLRLVYLGFALDVIAVLVAGQ